MANTGYREKKEGPIRLVYQGGEHIGNIIEPTFGGAKKNTQGFKAIARQTTHDSKHAAMTWLTSRHGATMKIENTGDNGTTFDVLRDNGWKKSHPYGFKHHLAAAGRATYTHPDLPGHHIAASYTNNTWQHHKSARDTTPHVGMGASSLHAHLQKVHASKTIEGIKEFVHYVQEEYPENWQEMVAELMRENFHQSDESQLGHGWSVHTTNNDYTKYTHKDFPKHQVTMSSRGKWGHVGKNAKLIAHGENGYAGLKKHLTQFHSVKEEPILGATPHSTMQRAVKASKVSIVKRDPVKAVTSPPAQNTIGESRQPKGTSLYKYDKITGYWKHERTFDDPANAPKYLEHYRKNEPDEHYHVGKNKPTHNPMKKEDNNSGSGQSGAYTNADMPHNRDIIDKDPRNQKNKGKVPGKKSKGLETVIKFANKANIRNADDSIPKIDSKPSFNQGKGEDKPHPSDDAEAELTIKRTMTGEPGDTVQINPLMKRTGAYGGTNYNPSPEGKKTPNT